VKGAYLPILRTKLRNESISGCGSLLKPEITAKHSVKRKKTAPTESPESKKNTEYH